MTQGTQSTMKVKKGVNVTMRDGVVLYADIYRPAVEGRFPVLLLRTPYSKDDGGAPSQASIYPPLGYVLVVQDCRGRFSSEGEFYPFFHEGKDGYDAVENRCSHANSPLITAKIYRGDQVACPIHGARFDLKTGAVIRTFPRGVAALPV